MALVEAFCFYVSNTISYNRVDLPVHTDFNFEVLWISLRPKILPRPISILFCAVVYCPPWYSSDLRKALCCYILNSFDFLTRKYPNAGSFITGDFNNLETHRFNNHLRFNQLVISNTRGNKILDKVFSNCGNAINLQLPCHHSANLIITVFYVFQFRKDLCLLP